MRLGKDVEVLPGSPNTLIYQGRVVIDQGGRNSSVKLNAEVQMATHGHMDHIFGLTTGAKVKYIPPQDMWALNMIGRRAMTYGFSSPQSPLFTYDLVIGEISLSGDPEVEIVPLPGHTPGHSGYILGSTLYAGDSFFGQKVLEGFVFPFFVDFWAALESMEKLRELFKAVENVVISHGPVYEKRKMQELLDFNVQYAGRLLKWIEDEIRGKEATSQEVTVRVMMRAGAKEVKPTNLLLNETVVKSILSVKAKEFRVSEKGLVYRG